MTVPAALEKPQIAMRPDILNPLFAEISALKGIGPALARPLERLGLARAVDVAFHLPVNYVDRKLIDELDMADAGKVIGIMLTPVDYRASGNARAPFRVQALDAHGKTDYFREANKRLAGMVAATPEIEILDAVVR